MLQLNQIDGLFNHVIKIVKTFSLASTLKHATCNSSSHPIHISAGEEDGDDDKAEEEEEE